MSHLDSSTLLLCLALLHLLCGSVVFLLQYNNSRYYWLGYSLAAALQASNALPALSLPAYPLAPMITLLTLLKGALLLAAFRHMLSAPWPLQLQRPHLLPLGGLALLAALLQPSALLLTIICPLLAVAFTSQLAWLLWQPAHRQQTAARVLAGYLAVWGGYQLLFLALAMLQPLDQLLAPALLLPRLANAVLLPLFFIYLSRERELADLQHLAQRDGLTGILNRRGFEDRADRLCTQHARLQQPLSLLVIDLDHFKRINDRYGHSTGDAALCNLAATISGNIRSGDLFGRMGGEEFCLLLPHPPLPGAREVASKLAACIREVTVGTGNDACQITASFGIATVPAGGHYSWPQLFELADRRLFRAKHAGRNQLVWCDA